MKRFYNYALLAGLFLSFGSLSAQTLNPRPILPSSKQISIEQLRTRFASPERAVGEWLFFDVAYENYFITTPTAGFVNFLFPDSTIQTNPAAPFPTWTHAVGQAYDLNSLAWASVPGTTLGSIDFTQPIKIDSILVWGFYLRVENTTDTLRLNFYEPTSGASGNYYTPYYFTGATTLTNLGVDSAFFLDLAYDFPTNEVKNPTQQWDIILDAAFFADSTDEGTHQHVLVPSTPLTMTLNDPGKRKGAFAFSETFIPGYSHVANVDVIGVDHNGYRPIAAEFNGTDSYPTLTESSDVTTSYLLPLDVRYNLIPAWNGHMIPMMAYTNPFNWEYVYIVPYVSQATSASLEENEEIDFNIYPNPATNMTNVNVASTFAGDATISLIDLSGKVVKQFTNNKVNVGNNVFNLDLTDVNNGAYIIQLNSEGHQLSSKLMISK